MSGIFAGIMIPFIGTTAGAACVFFLKNALKPSVQKAFLGFASGVMVAASVWSLLIPSMDMSGHMGKLAFIPASVGFILGIGFLLLLDEIIPHLHIDTEQPKGPDGIRFLNCILGCSRLPEYLNYPAEVNSL